MIDGRKHVDGGLIANAPDAVLLAEGSELSGAAIEECIF
jgi:predicted acylesterase/phospholipase RssA